MYDELSTNVMSALTDLKEIDYTSDIYKQNKTPEFISTQIDGIPSIKAIDFLFSPQIDKVIDTLLDVCINGKFDAMLDGLSRFVKTFDGMGIGTGFFNGRIGGRVVETIKNSVNSVKFQKTSSKIKKVLLILKNLKRNIKTYNDPIERQKYEEALYAIKSVISVIATIYKNRKKINGKVVKGLNNIIFEETDETIKIDKVTF